MRICFFTIKETSPYIGGVEKTTSILSNWFESQNIEVFYFHLYGEERERHFILPTNKPTKVITSYIDNIVTKHNIKIIIDQHCRKDLFSHKVLKSKVKIIRCWHQNIFERHITKCLLEPFLYKKCKELFMNFLFWLNTPIRRCKQKILFKNSLQNTDRLVVLSKNYMQNIKKAYKTNKINAIYNAITTVEKTNNKKKNTIIYCGRIIHNPKNILFLIKFWKKIFKKYPEWNFVIVGDGEDRYILEKLIKKEGLSRISITGFTNPQKYYEEAKILILPSYNEGFGMVIPEAMINKCVPIVFNSSSVFSEIIINEKNGIIVNGINHSLFIKKCEELMNNDTLLDKLSTNAHTFASTNFNIDKIGHQWINLFNEILSD